MRAAGISVDYQDYYYFLQSIGRAWPELGRRVLVLELTHRDDSPWDDPTRRPSHADRRKALQAACLAEELSHALPSGLIPRKIRHVIQRLLRITV